MALYKYLEDEKDNIILSKNVCKGVPENLAKVQPPAFTVFFIFNNADPHIYRLTAAYIHSCMEDRQKLVRYFIIAFVLA